MTTIYFVRHCEATGNAEHLFQGRIDTDITELGEKQLKFLKKRFENIKLDKIYSSPLLRAIKTAEAVKGDKNMDIEICDGLIELDGGIVDGEPFSKAFSKIPGLFETWENHPEDFAPENGEPMRHAYERIYNTLLNIANQNKGKTVACSTHGGATRCLLCRLLKNDIGKLKEINWLDNTAVTLIKIDDSGKAYVEYYNDTSHLPKELLPVRNKLSNIFKVN